MIKKLIRFLKEDVWGISLSRHSVFMRFLIRQLRIILFAVKGFKEDKIQLRASALTYFTLLSVVPVAAMIFGIAKGFGYEKRIESAIRDNFRGQSELQVVMEKIIDFAKSLLENTSGGLIAGIGLVILFWSVMKVLGNIEGSFNVIWRIKQGRSFTRKFSDYLSVMLIAPVLIILSSGANVFITTRFSSIQESVPVLGYLGPAISFLFKLIPYALICFLFTFIYIAMPNTRVKFGNGLYGALIAGTIFQITQWIYIEFQVGASRYGAIYGSFAALPLFLIWLQISWLIVLLGAELSFAYQNIENYESETRSLHVSHYHKRILTLLVIRMIVRNFEKGRKPLTAAGISHKLEMPIRLVRDILYCLSDSGIVLETKTGSPKESGFVPATDIGRLDVKFVLEKIEKSGSSRLMARESKELERITRINGQIFDAIGKSPVNKPIRDL